MMYALGSIRVRLTTLAMPLLLCVTPLDARATPGVPAGGLADDEHRDPGVRKDALRLAAEKQAAETGAAVRSHVAFRARSTASLDFGRERLGLNCLECRFGVKSSLRTTLP